MQDLNQFNIACEQLLNGKYILIDIKISSLLKILDESEKLKNIISNSLSKYNFNFNNELTENIVLPENDIEIVSYVYTFLYKLKNGDLNLGENPDALLTQLIPTLLPSFSKAINELYNKNHQEIETNEYQQNIFNNLKSTINLILENLDKYKFKTTNKEEFLMLINSLFQASDKNDKKLVYSLMIGLDYFTQCNKKLRTLYLSLEECFSN